MLNMLTFCYPGLNKVTLVSQLLLLLICKTAIGETWNTAIDAYEASAKKFSGMT